MTVIYIPDVVGLQVRYEPLDEHGIPVTSWAGTLVIPQKHIPSELEERLRTFFKITSTLLPEQQIQFPDGSIRNPGKPPLRQIRIGPDRNMIHASAGTLNHHSPAGSFSKEQYTTDGWRVLEDALASVEAECWKHLESRTGTTSNAAEPIQVFVSYRKRPDIERFAESVAHRVEREKIRVRFDKWDIVAGDSLPGKIEEAFNESRACIVILSGDFKDGKWATKEMQTAITKAVEEKYRVIPILFENCEVPQLLKDLVRVDFSDHNPDLFEEKFREVIQGIFGLTRTPFSA